MAGSKRDAGGSGQMFLASLVQTIVIGLVCGLIVFTVDCNIRQKERQTEAMLKNLKAVPADSLLSHFCSECPDLGSCPPVTPCALGQNYTDGACAAEVGMSPFHLDYVRTPHGLSDVTRTTRHPDIATYEHPSHVRIPEFFTAEECQWLIKEVPNLFPKTQGQVGGGDGGKDTNLNHRLANQWVAPLEHPDFKWVTERVLKVVNQYNERYWQYGIPYDAATDLVEPLLFVEYDGQVKGHYDWHSDIGIKGPRAMRKLSVVIILSDAADYEGGTFQLKAGEEIHMPRTQGAMMIFPSFVLHKVTPVTAGMRYSMVVQISSRHS